MEIIKIEDYSFQYSGSDTVALDEVSQRQKRRICHGLRLLRLGQKHAAAHA